MAYSDNEHIHPFGCTLEVSVDLGSTWTFVNDLISIEPPTQEFKESDDTTLKSPNKIILTTPGWQEAGELKLTTYGHKTQGWGTLYTDFTGQGAGASGSTQTYQWRITLPKLATESVSGSTFVGSGWMKNFKIFGKAEKAQDDKLATEITIRMRSNFTI